MSARSSSAPWVARDRIIGAAIAVVALVHVLYYFPRVVDDLFISLRYAENLAHGHGAIYNEGERVEGYSSPAWMLLQTFAFVLRAEPITFCKIAATLLFFATLFGMRVVTRDVYGVAAYWSWIPAGALALNSYIVDWTVLGLETPLHLATLVWTPLLVKRAIDRPSRRANVLAACALVVLGLTRPESPLYLLIILGCYVRKREHARFVVPAGAVLSLLLLVRRGYYGDWVANTYHVKGAPASFALGKLLGLVGQGARPIEAVAMAVGLVAFLYFSWKRRAFAQALIVLACLYFTASVTIDWMPNLRHLLPVTLFAPIGLACLIDELERAERLIPQYAAIAVSCLGAWQVFTIDSRLSPIEHFDHWATRKDLGHWHMTMQAFERVETDQVKRMDDYNLGQIAQCWPVLETSDAPVLASWWAGRDIGAIGYLTGVRVFDTAGLVTEEVSATKAWTEHGVVPPELLEDMLAKRPVAADLFDGWDAALERDPKGLAHYRVVILHGTAPQRIIATDRAAPSKAEVARRYHAFAAKMPGLYHLNTLYGESMGAAVDKRLRAVE